MSASDNGLLPVDISKWNDSLLPARYQQELCHFENKYISKW